MDRQWGVSLSEGEGGSLRRHFIYEGEGANRMKVGFEPRRLYREERVSRRFVCSIRCLSEEKQNLRLAGYRGDPWLSQL